MAASVDLVRRFSRLRALVIGDALLDSYLEGTATRLCSEGPVPIVRLGSTVRAPGGAANTAANIAALGAEVCFAGYVGDDAAGATLRALLRERGIDDRWLVADRFETPHKQRVIADGQYVTRLDAGDVASHALAVRRRLLHNVSDAFSRCDLVVVSDYGYGAVDRQVIAQVRALRAAHPCVLVVDSKRLHLFRRTAATAITPNLLEARLAVGRDRAIGRAECDPADMASIETVGRLLLRRIDAACATITLAGHGALIVHRDGPALHQPAHAVSAPSVAGAGDTFAATMALAMAAGGGVAEATALAIDASGIAVTKRWTATVALHELLQRASLRDQAECGAMDGGAGPGVPAQRDVARLAGLLQRERRAGHTIVFTNGVFDIVHAGHVHFLRRARELGDVLVVGINSDRGARMATGRDGPINRARDRAAMVAALDPVDHVVLFDEDTPAGLIRALRPDIHVKGGDYADIPLPESAAVAEVGARIVIVPLLGQDNSRAIIDRIAARLHIEREALPVGAAR